MGNVHDPRRNQTRHLEQFVGKTVASVEIDDAGYMPRSTFMRPKPKYAVVSFTDGSVFSVELTWVSDETYQTSGSGKGHHELKINYDEDAENDNARF